MRCIKWAVLKQFSYQSLIVSGRSVAIIQKINFHITKCSLLSCYGDLGSRETRKCAIIDGRNQVESTKHILTFGPLKKVKIYMY